jgi:hypothetical protein
LKLLNQFTLPGGPDATCRLELVRGDYKVLR